jgi:hypothetical protein
MLNNYLGVIGYNILITYYIIKIYNIRNNIEEENIEEENIEEENIEEENIKEENIKEENIEEENIKEENIKEENIKNIKENIENIKEKNIENNFKKNIENYFKKDIKNNLIFLNIIRILGYIIVLYIVYKKINNNTCDIDEISIGHILLFIFYFFEIFMIKNSDYLISYLSLFSSLLLITQNSINTFAFGLKIVYYVIRIMNSYQHFNFLYYYKITGFICLLIYYINLLLIKL